MPQQLQISERQASILQQIIRRAKSPQSLVMRAKIIQAGAKFGQRNKQIARELRISAQRVTTWRSRWLTAGPRLAEVEAGGNEPELEAAIMAVLADQPRRGAPATFTAEQICQIIAVACESPALSDRPITEWTARELADEVSKRQIVESISPSQVSRFLEEAELKPHRSRYWLNNQRAEDPAQFDQEVKTVCELYQAALTWHEQGVHVMSTDEKTGIQALERKYADKPMQPGRVRLLEHEYIRHGTQALIANLEVATGACVAPSIGETRKEEDFLAHIEQTIALDPEGQWIFVVDQLNTHMSESLVCLVARECGIEDDLGVKGSHGILQSMATRAAFLQDESHRLRFVYTPKHTSWLNQIEIWFSILVRRLLKRGSFSSVHQLRERILAFIDYFNKTMAKPFKWTYAGRPLQT